MLSRVLARCVATAATRGAHRPFLLSVAVALGASTLGGCQPVAIPVAAADPAAPVAGVHHRSAIAPYTSLRPVAPSRWRERNDAVAPGGDDRSVR